VDYFQIKPAAHPYAAMLRDHGPTTARPPREGERGSRNSLTTPSHMGAWESPRHILGIERRPSKKGGGQSSCCRSPRTRSMGPSGGGRVLPDGPQPHGRRRYPHRLRGRL